MYRPRITQDSGKVTLLLRYYYVITFTLRLSYQNYVGWDRYGY